MRTGSNHTKEAWKMSQEILFLLFMVGELALIVTLYTYWIIPKVSLATNTLFEKRMLDKTWDIPAMLEDYTEHLAIVFSEIIKKLVPEVLGGYMSGGIKQLKTDPDNALMMASAEFMESLPFPAQLVANKFLPKLQQALDNATEKPGEATATYKPGLDKR
jgi:hypothetical protein